MLSSSFKKLTRPIKNNFYRKFGGKYEFSQASTDANSINWDKIANYPAHIQPKETTPQYLADSPLSYELTKLPSGITILTQNSPFPSYSQLGILQRLGTRNENEETRGSGFFLQHMNFISEQEQLKDFELTQNSGAIIQSNDDIEYSYLKRSFIPEDSDLILSKSLKAAFQVQTLSKEIEESMGQMIEEYQNQHHTIDQLMLEVAYNGKTCGNNLKGKEIQLNKQKFLDFQNMLSPERIVIAAANVGQHQNFVNIIQNKLISYPYLFQRKQIQNTQSEYVGGFKHVTTGSDNEAEVALMFESVPWNHENMTAMHVIGTMLGNASSFSTGGPGKGMHSRCTKLLNTIGYLDSSCSINNHYTDGGVFGIKGKAENFQNFEDLIKQLLNELISLSQIKDEIELQRNKNILMSMIYLTLERQADRLEEVAKNLFSFNRIKALDYEIDIKKVNLNQVRTILTNILQTKPTLVLLGGETDKTKTLKQKYDEILAFQKKI